MNQTPQPSMTGGQSVAQTLARLGARTIFSVSGNQILPIYDAAPDAGLRMVHLRHESAAAYAAAAHAEVTGRVGVALVSAGPGFLASLTGVAVARSMELPLLLLSGAAPAAGQGRGAFQDLDQASAARVACKDSLDARSIEGIAETLLAAWELALAGVPGPVHVSLPADALLTRTSAPDTQPTPQPSATETPAGLREIADRLARAERPAIIVRPSAERGMAGAALTRLAEQLGVPPIVTGAPRGLSDLKYAEAFRALPEADVVLVVAPPDFAAGFLDADLFRGDVLLIDAPGDVEPARAPALRCRAAPSGALPQLADFVSTSATDPTWRARLARRDPLPEALDDAEGIHPLNVAAAILEVLRPDDTLVLDGGEFCQWVRLGLRDAPNRMLWNGKLGAIGGSFPPPRPANWRQPCVRSCPSPPSSATTRAGRPSGTSRSTATVPSARSPRRCCRRATTWRPPASARTATTRPTPPRCVTRWSAAWRRAARPSSTRTCVLCRVQRWCYEHG
jgi:acetolactate synthase-1/2/3 large subunit